MTPSTAKAPSARPEPTKTTAQVGPQSTIRATDYANLSRDELLAKLAEMEAQQATPNVLTFEARPLGKEKTASDGKVYPGKGNLLLRGIQRQPVSLYAEQWERIQELILRGELQATLDENHQHLVRRKAYKPNAIVREAIKAAMDVFSRYDEAVAGETEPQGEAPIVAK